MFCIYLRTNSDLCHLQHKLIGFYNRDEKCLLRGLCFVFKMLSLYSHKSKVNQSHYRPDRPRGISGVWGSQISRQSAHEGGKVVSPTQRPLLPPENVPGTHFCYRLSQPQGHSAAGRIISMKNSNRTRDLPTCSAVPQPTTLPCAHYIHTVLLLQILSCCLHAEWTWIRATKCDSPWKN